MRRIAILCLIFLFSFQLYEIPVSSTSISEDNLLTVGFDPSIPPFQYIENDEVVGFNIALLDAIADDYNFIVDYIPMSKEVSIEKLKNEEIDLILGIRYDSSLEEELEYSENVVQSVVCMLIKAEEKESLQTNLSQSYYIASVESNSNELKFLENFRRMNFNVAFNQEDAFQLLMMDRADFLIGVRDSIEFLMNKYNITNEYVIIDSYTTPVEYLIAVKSGNNNLLTILNSGLSRLKLSGGYEELYADWIENSEAGIAKKMNNIIRRSISGAVIGLGIVAIIIVWNRNLKNQVRIKTRELVESNSELEKQIAETRNNVELKNLMCESSPRGIVIFDMDGKVSAFNDSAVKIANLEKPPIGECVYDFEPINLMLKNTIGIIFNENRSYTCEEFRYIHNNNESIYRYVMYPLTDYEKKFRGAIITIENITEEILIKEQIVEKEKNRVLTQVIAGISHEIRNPLSTIQTFIELIPNKLSNSKFREDLINIVPKELHRVDKLIEGLIDYSKPRSQTITEFDIGEIIENSVAILQHVFDKFSIEVNVNIENNLIIVADESQVKQVIINLLLNAKDAIVDKADNSFQGKIDIQAHRRASEVIVEFLDNGIGMDEDEIRKAFDIFYTTKDSGTGLGLSISKRMLEGNKAFIQINSKKNDYTRIIIVFPLINSLEGWELGYEA